MCAPLTSSSTSIERPLYHTCGETSPSDLDLEGRPRGPDRGLDVGEPDEAAESRRFRPAGHLAHAPVRRENVVAVPRNPRLVERDAHEPPGEPGTALRAQSGRADELALVELHDPSEAGFERRRRPVHVGAA